MSGPGHWPGRNVLETLMVVFGDLADTPEGVTGLPFLPQLADRGAGAEPIARTAALLPELAVELGPHGWKLADHPGMDQSRAQAFLREDLDSLAIAGLGYAGPLTVQLVGPWTLAASVYLARGDRVLADRGAVRALVEALAAGLVEHVAAVRAQVPGAEVRVQIDESLLGQVAAGVIPTFSGYSRLRAVHGPDIIDGLRPVIDAAHAIGVESTVHVDEVWHAIPPVVLAGADAVGVTMGALAAESGTRAPGGGRSTPSWNERGWELLARAIERDVRLWAALPPAAVSQCAGADVRALADLVSVPWRRLGLPARGLSDVVLTSARNAATSGGASVNATSPASLRPDQARGQLGALLRAAAILAERADA